MVDSLLQNILIAEDHAPSQDALRLALESWGHQVLCAANGHEALAILERVASVQLLITDWRMPGMDGLTLCRRVRELSDRYLHIIVMTARNERGDRVTALEAGADAFLGKPLDLQELRSQILVAGRIIDLERRLGQQIDKLQRAHTDLKEESEISETLRSLGIELAAELDRDRLLESVVAAAARLCGAEVAAFAASHREEGEVCLAAPGLSCDVNWLARFAPPGAEQSVRLYDLGRDPRWAARNDPPLRAYLAVPVVAGSGGALGTLYFGHRRQGAFSRRDERMVQGLAAQAAVALDNARLYRRARESQCRMREQNLELKRRYEQLEALRAETQSIQQKLERVLSGIQEAFVVLDSQCRYAYLNQRAAEMAGARIEELLGRSFWEMFPDLVGSQLDQELQRALKADAVIRLEEYYPTRERWYEHRIHPSAEGLLLVFSADTTETRIAEMAARKIELWLQAIFDQSSGFFAILTPGGRVVEVNQALLAAMGVSRDEVVDVLVWETGWWREPATLRHGVLHAALGSTVHEECTYSRHDRSPRMMARSLTPIKDETGQVIYVLLQGIDVTDQKTIQVELERTRDQALLANRMKSEFLANMSHEIRTPLSGIRGMTEFLLDTPLSPEQKEYAESIVQCSEGLLAVVGDVLDLSRIEAGQLEVRETAFGLREAVGKAVGIFRYRIEEKGLDLNFFVEEGVPEVVIGDQDRLRQLIVNLVNNAIKFTDQGEIAIRVHGGPLPGSARFEVADTGIGIPDEDRPRLFQPFTQLDSSPSRRHGGTGLGLSIVRRLVELMGGRVGFESGVGRGSTFWFELPFKQGRLEDLPRESPSPASADLLARGRDLQVLVAEDNPINRRVVLLQLHKLGVSATAVANGREALEAVRQQQYDLILMDCQMPELDGYEATRRIRSDANGQNDVVIVALTAHALKGERQRCLEAGMNDYLSKPTSTSALESLLFRWCVAPRAKV